MTSHTTKQEARAYQRAHGVPYAEARRRVMNGDAPPPEQTQAAPSWSAARGYGLTVGSTPETGEGVPWVRRGRNASLHPSDGSAVPPPTLGVFGPTNSGRTSLVRSLVQQADPAPTLILCTEDTRRSEYTGLLSTASTLDPRDLFSTDGAVNPPALEAATDGVALVVLDLSDTLTTYETLAALHSAPERAAAVAFTHPVYGPCDAPWPDSTGVDLIGMVSDAPQALGFCSSLVVLTGKGRGYLGHLADSSDDARHLILELMGDRGLTEAEVAQHLGRSPDMMRLVRLGKRPGNSLVTALRELLDTGQVSYENKPVIRRRNDGKLAAVRAPLEPFTNMPTSPDIQFSLQRGTGTIENPGQILTMYLGGDRLDSVALPEYEGRGSSIPDTVLMAQSDRAAVSLALRNGYDVTMPEWIV